MLGLPFPFQRRSEARLFVSDFVTPTVQQLYASTAAVAAQCGRTPTEWYLGNLASGDWTGVNGTVLTKGAGSFRFQQTCPGWNGTDMTSGFRAVEFVGTDATPQSFFASNNTLYDLTQSLTFVLNVRLLRPPSANRGFIGKDTSNAAATPGYYLYMSSGGSPTALIADGASVVTVSGPGITTTYDSVANGAPQWVALKMNLTTGNAEIFAYRVASPAIVMPAGSKSSATPFRVGGMPFLFSCELLQIIQWGVFTGAEAEAFTVTDLNELDTWSRTPSNFAHYVRYNMTAPVVGRTGLGDLVQFYAGGNVTNFVQFAHAYSPNATRSTQQLGVQAERGTSSSSSTGAINLQKRNRLLRTDDLSNAAWTKTNATTAQNAGTDPAGFNGAASITATADNGFARQDYTSEINEIHTHSIFVRRNGGSNVSGRLVAIRTDTSAELGSVVFSATSTWERITLQFTAPTTTTRILIEIDTSGQSIFATFAQAEYGSLTSYMPQSSTLLNKDDVEWYIDNAGNAVYDPDGGRIETYVIGWAAEVPSTGAFVFTTNAGAGNEDRHFIQRDALTSLVQNEERIFDNAGVIVSQLTLPDLADNRVETLYADSWEATRELPNGGIYDRAQVDESYYVTGAVVAAAPWATGAAANRIYPGMRHTYTAHIEGIVESLIIWGPIY
jgi:hypothetical protein